MSEHAPAKINLALHVVGKRADGYHLLESLAVFTAFGDKVSVAAAAEDSVRIDGPFGAGLPTNESNLAVRARDELRAFLLDADRQSPDSAPISPRIPPPLTPPLKGEEVVTLSESPSPLRGGVRGGGKVRNAVSLHLEKNLPISSGIGGGSSDAAAVLKALNRLWNCGLDDPRLARIGARLGADVPMCIAARPLIARGVGEEIETVPGFPHLPMLLVNPGVSVSTPAVFRALPGAVNAPLPPFPDRPNFDGLVHWLKGTRNDLLAPATSLAPEIAVALSEIEAEKPAFARMSGSGATCFGLFARQQDAYRAAMAIRSRRPSWFVVATQTLP